MVSKVGHKSKMISRKPTFEGITEKTKGCIFNCYDAGQATSYTNTIKEISQCRGTKCKKKSLSSRKSQSSHTQHPRFPSDTVSLSKKTHGK